jgi:hypothetical protein
MAGKPKKPSQNDQKNMWYALHAWKKKIGRFKIYFGRFMLNIELLLQGWKTE